MNYIEDSVFFEIRHRAVSELRWKQVKILHGPATVMKELCLVGHCADVLRMQCDVAEECGTMRAWEGEQGDES